MTPTIVIDAGHGGYDNGATYRGRKEKDDALRLATAVGNRLSEDGYNVIFTRTTDVYQTPFEKAQIANRVEADYFFSFHRNSGRVPNTYKGVQSLVFAENEEIGNRIGADINENLSEAGFRNLGIEARPNLVVLRRTGMPAVLVEVGFINSDEDNAIFDQKFQEIVTAIVAGIENGVGAPGENHVGNVRSQGSGRSQGNGAVNAEGNRAGESRNASEMDKNYWVQIGLFRYESNADYQAELAKDAGFQSVITYEEPYYAVRIPVGRSIEDATRLQERLRRRGFDTLIVEL